MCAPGPGLARAQPTQQAAAAEHTERLVARRGRRELLADGDVQLVGQAAAAALARVVGDAREELEGEARLRHREAVEVVEHAGEEGREDGERLGVGRRHLHQHRQGGVDLGRPARARVREKLADELLPQVGLRKLLEEQRVHLPAEGARGRRCGAHQARRDAQLRRVVREQRVVVAADGVAQQGERHQVAGGLVGDELGGALLALGVARLRERAQQPPIDRLVLGGLLDALQLGQQQRSQVAAQPQGREQRVEEQRLRPRVAAATSAPATRPAATGGVGGVGREQLGREAGSQRGRDLGRVGGAQVGQKEAHDARKVSGLGGGDGADDEGADLLLVVGVHVEGRQRLERGRGELRVLLQQLRQQLHRLLVLAVVHEVGHHQHVLALEGRLSDLKHLAEGLEQRCGHHARSSRPGEEGRAEGGTLSEGVARFRGADFA